MATVTKIVGASDGADYATISLGITLAARNRQQVIQKYAFLRMAITIGRRGKEAGPTLI
jgi:hypothetical protein